MPGGVGGGMLRGIPLSRLCVKGYKMSQVESNKGAHWPSLFWFCVGILSFISGIYQSMPSSYLLGLGFFCMGYSSIRLLSKNFFTRKLFFTVKQENNYRELDGIVQFIGFIFIVAGLATSYIYT